MLALNNIFNTQQDNHSPHKFCPSLSDFNKGQSKYAQLYNQVSYCLLLFPCENEQITIRKKREKNCLKSLLQIFHQAVGISQLITAQKQPEFVNNLDLNHVLKIYDTFGAVFQIDKILLMTAELSMSTPRLPLQKLKSNTHLNHNWLPTIPLDVTHVKVIKQI